MSGRRCSRARVACCCRRDAPAMADARATFRCQRHRSACLGGMDIRGPDTAGKRPQRSLGFDRAMVNVTCEVRRKQIDAEQLPPFARAERFLRLIAKPTVKLRATFVDSRLN